MAAHLIHDARALVSPLDDAAAQEAEALADRHRDRAQKEHDDQAHEAGPLDLKVEQHHDGDDEEGRAPEGVDRERCILRVALTAQVLCAKKNWLCIALRAHACQLPRCVNACRTRSAHVLCAKTKITVHCIASACLPTLPRSAVCSAHVLCILRLWVWPCAARGCILSGCARGGVYLDLLSIVGHERHDLAGGRLGKADGVEAEALVEDGGHEGVAHCEAGLVELKGHRVLRKGLDEGCHEQATCPAARVGVNE